MALKHVCSSSLAVLLFAVAATPVSASFLVDDFSSGSTTSTATGYAGPGTAPTRTQTLSFGSSTLSPGTPGTLTLVSEFVDFGFGSGEVLTASFGYNFTSPTDFSTESGIILQGIQASGGDVQVELFANGATTNSIATVLDGSGPADLFLDFGSARTNGARDNLTSFSLNLIASASTPISLSLVGVQAIPEPTSLALAVVGAGLCGWGAFRRRRRSTVEVAA